MLAGLIAFGLLGQSSKPIPVQDSLQLDPKTRPFVELPQLRNLKCITVSQVKVRDPKSDVVTHTIRVYRFTYKATYEAEVRRLKKELVPGDGWRVEEDIPVQLIMGRDLKHAKISGQGVILRKDSKASFDRKAVGQTKLTKTTGWVSVSVNEILR